MYIVWQDQKTGISLRQCCYTVLIYVSGGEISIDLSPPSWHKMTTHFAALGVNHGGHRAPDKCAPRQRVALVIPYRDRVNHLHLFLNHIHNILVKQNMEYQVFVIEQVRI